MRMPQALTLLSSTDCGNCLGVTIGGTSSFRLRYTPSMPSAASASISFGSSLSFMRTRKLPDVQNARGCGSAGLRRRPASVARLSWMTADCISGRMALRVCSRRLLKACGRSVRRATCAARL